MKGLKCMKNYIKLQTSNIPALEKKKNKVINLYSWKSRFSLGCNKSVTAYQVKS